MSKEITLKDLKKRDDLESEEVKSGLKEHGFTTCGDVKNPKKFKDFAQGSLNELRMDNATRIMGEADIAKQMTKLLNGKPTVCPKCGEKSIGMAFKKGNSVYVRFTCSMANPAVPNGGCQYQEIIPWDKFKSKFKK